MPDLFPELNSETFSVIGLVLLLVGKLIWEMIKHWRFSIKPIAEDPAYDDKHHEETREIVDEHEVRLAVHDEKHQSHEKRLDRVEDERSQSAKK